MKCITVVFLVTRKRMVYTMWSLIFRSLVCFDTVQNWQSSPWLLTSPLKLADIWIWWIPPLITIHPVQLCPHFSYLEARSSKFLKEKRFAQSRELPPVWKGNAFLSAFFECSLSFETSFNFRCKATKTLGVDMLLAESLAVDYSDTKANGSDVLIRL